MYLEDPRLKFLEPDDSFNAYYTQKLKLYATIKRLEQTAPSKSNVDSKTNSKCNYDKLIKIIIICILFYVLFVSHKLLVNSVSFHSFNYYFFLN